MPELQRVDWGEIELHEGVTLRPRAIRIGAGAPRHVIVTGLHGDETTGAYVLQHLVEEGTADLPGTVDLVTMPNWLGLIMDRRDSPLDGANLNRLFGERTPPGGSANIAAALLQFMAGADLVLDLHSWESPSCVLGISYRLPSVSTRAGRALAHLACEYVWIPEVEGFGDTLGARLTSMVIENAGIEYPPAWLIAPGDVARWSDALRRALRDSESPPAFPPAGGRRAIRTPAAGLFDPLVDPGQRVREGQVLARILGVSTLSVECTLTAPEDATVLHLENRRFLHPGDVAVFLGGKQS
ncbi:MAG: succinylglutamate desuccinylase/aspartoacylase family protein [Thermoanaerobaculia bacterium]